MVMISSSSCMIASDRQELMRRPLTRTVQAPHWPWSQPFFVPVRSRCSRSASSSVVLMSASNCRRTPFTLRLVKPDPSADWLGLEVPNSPRPQKFTMEGASGQLSRMRRRGTRPGVAAGNPFGRRLVRLPSRWRQMPISVREQWRGAVVCEARRSVAVSAEAFFSPQATSIRRLLRCFSLSRCAVSGELRRAADAPSNLASRAAIEPDAAGGRAGAATMIWTFLSCAWLRSPPD